MDAVEDWQAQKAQAICAMIQWRSPGLQLAFDRWVCYTDEMRHEHRRVGRSGEREDEGEGEEKGEGEGERERGRGRPGEGE